MSPVSWIFRFSKLLLASIPEVASCFTPIARAPMLATDAAIFPNELRKAFAIVSVLLRLRPRALTSSLAALRVCVSPFMFMVIFTSLFLDMGARFMVKYR